MEVAHLNSVGRSLATAMTSTPTRQHQDSQSWLHGVEGVTKDAGGYVYWHGREVEHFSYSPRDHRDEAMATKRLKNTCRALEAAGRTVTSTTYIDWIRVLATVHVVNSAQFTDVLGSAAYYRRTDPRNPDGEKYRVTRGATAIIAIENATGLTARLDNEWHSDPTAVVLVKTSEQASRDGTEGALSDLRQRFLQAYPGDGPRAVAALVTESRYEDGHYAGYVGVRLYTGPFDEPSCPSIGVTLQVVREFARAFGCLA